MSQVEWYLVYNSHSISVFGTNQFHCEHEAGNHGSTGRDGEEEPKSREHVPVHWVRCGHSWY